MYVKKQNNVKRVNDTLRSRIFDYNICLCLCLIIVIDILYTLFLLVYSLHIKVANLHHK